MSMTLIHAGAIGSTSHAALSVDIPALGVPELRQMLHTADGPKEIRTRRDHAQWRRDLRPRRRHVVPVRGVEARGERGGQTRKAIGMSTTEDTPDQPPGLSVGDWIVCPEEHRNWRIIRDVGPEGFLSAYAVVDPDGNHPVPSTPVAACRECGASLVVNGNQGLCFRVLRGLAP